MTESNISPFNPERFHIKSPSQEQRPADEASTRPCSQRIPRQVEPFVMIPVSSFTRESVRDVFGPRERLYLLLLHLSRRGQKPVTLTTAAVKPIGLSRS